MKDFISRGTPQRQLSAKQCMDQKNTKDASQLREPAGTLNTTNNTFTLPNLSPNFFFAVRLHAKSILLYINRAHK